MNKITVNGKEYKSIEEMPPETRQAYEQAIKALADKDGNGVPDIFEGKAEAVGSPEVTTSTDISIENQTYHSLDEVPPELRQACEEALRQVGVKHNGSSHADPTRRPEGNQGYNSMPSTRQDSFYKIALYLLGLLCVGLLLYIFIAKG